MDGGPYFLNKKQERIIKRNELLPTRAAKGCEERAKKSHYYKILNCQKVRRIITALRQFFGQGFSLKSK